MGFDLADLRAAVARHGQVARVVIADVKGSSPREVGAAMLVWQGGQSGTIGGGALEYQAAEAARAFPPTPRLTRHALGPDLGQCCGGSVQLLCETFDATALASIEDTDVHARPIGAPGDMPLPVKRLLATARAQGKMPAPQLLHGWMVEPLTRPIHAVWIWGAGHVGRALVATLAPLPQVAITWVDTAQDRFPESMPANVTPVAAADPALLMPHAPADAHHLILTYSHAIDLALCHAALGHRFASVGLIGSASKWARFKTRLAALGHSADQIARIQCPIGAPSLGKHPQAIAIGVAADLMQHWHQASLQREKSA